MPSRRLSKVKRTLLRPAHAKRSAPPRHETMQAVLVREDGSHDLYVGEAPTPPVERDHVLMRVHATAVNRADLLQRRGLYPPPAGESPIMGLEAAGTIAECGPGVSGWRIGDRVCALLAGGGYAEFVAVHKDMLLPIPPQLGFVEAAAIPEAFYTAYVNLVMEAGLAEGETVLIHAGGSGVGTAAIQIAKHVGARVLITAGSSTKIRRCRELGADAGIDYKNEDFAQRAAELSERGGVDVVLDCIGGSYLDQHLRVLLPKGRLVIIGLMGGARADTNLALVVGKRLRLIGSVLRSRSLEEKVAITREFRKRIWPLFANEKLRPVIDARYPLADAAAAHEHVAANKNFGKVVLTLDA